MNLVQKLLIQKYKSEHAQTLERRDKRYTASLQLATEFIEYLPYLYSATYQIVDDLSRLNNDMTLSESILPEHAVEVLSAIRSKSILMLPDEYFIFYVKRELSCLCMMNSRSLGHCAFNLEAYAIGATKAKKKQEELCYECWSRLLYQKDIIDRFYSYKDFKILHKKNNTIFKRIKRFFDIK